MPKSSLDLKSTIDLVHQMCQKLRQVTSPNDTAEEEVLSLMNDLLERLNKQFEQVLLDRRLLGPKCRYCWCYQNQQTQHQFTPFAIQQFPPMFRPQARARRLHNIFCAKNFLKKPPCPKFKMSCGRLLEMVARDDNIDVWGGRVCSRYGCQQKIRHRDVWYCFEGDRKKDLLYCCVDHVLIEFVEIA